MTWFTTWPDNGRPRYEEFDGEEQARQRVDTLTRAGMRGALYFEFPTDDEQETTP